MVSMVIVLSIIAGASQNRSYRRKFGKQREDIRQNLNSTLQPNKIGSVLINARWWPEGNLGCYVSAGPVSRAFE